MEGRAQAFQPGCANLLTTCGAASCARGVALLWKLAATKIECLARNDSAR